MRWDWLEATRALGVAALLDKDLPEAVSHLSAVWDHTQREGVLDPGAFPAATDLIEALVETESYDAARGVVEVLAEIARSQDHPWARVGAERGTAMVAIHADSYTDSAGEALEAAATAYGAARSRVRRGADAARARPGAAAGQEVGGGARRPGAGRRRASRRSGLPAGPRTPAPSWSGSAPDDRPPEAASPTTERRVAELAVEGLANKEIARTLVVTVNTVEFHLRNTYAKLGIRSRVQLASRLHEVDESEPERG